MSSNDSSQLLALQFYGKDVLGGIVTKFQYTTKQTLSTKKNNATNKERIAGTDSDNAQFAFSFTKEPGDGKYFYDEAESVLYLQNDKIYEINMRPLNKNDAGINLAWDIIIDDRNDNTTNKNNDEIANDISSLVNTTFKCAMRLKLPKLKKKSRKKCFAFSIKQGNESLSTLSKDEQNLVSRINKLEGKITQKRTEIEEKKTENKRA